MTRIAAAFSESTIAQKAGQRAMWRASAIRQDAIEIIEASADRIAATVRGSLPYRTVLWIDSDMQPRFSCTCPQGDEEKFCKHCVALALTLHDGSSTREMMGPEHHRTRPSDQQFASQVKSLTHADLVELVLDAATRDEITLGRLINNTPTGLVRTTFDVKMWRSRLTAAYGSKSHFVEYRRAPQWADEITGVIEELFDQLDDENAADVVSLLEFAFTRTEKAMAHVDDSDGWITMIADSVGNAHLEASKRARIASKALARHLAAFELDYELDTFRGAAERYADALGDQGLAEYRRVIDKAALRVDEKSTKHWSSARFRIRHARTGLALATGNIDELISVLSTERLLPDDFLTIVNALMSADRAPEAVDWAYRGLSSSDSTEHYRRDLRERLVEILIQCERIDEVGFVRLQGFRAAPTPEALRRYLATCTNDHRAAERLALLEWLEERAVEHRSSQTANDLVRILLAEGEVVAAYDAARRFGCAPDLRHTLARAIEKARPRDAIALHQLEIDELIDRRRRQDYQAAAALLNRVRRLYEACGAESEWFEYLNAVLTTHRAKSSLMAILRERGVAVRETN